MLYWIEAQRKANINPRFFKQSRKYWKGSNKITMLTTNSEVPFNDRWFKLEMRACCSYEKPPFYLRRKPEPS